MKSPYIFKHIAPTSNTSEKEAGIFLLHGLGSNEEDLLQLVESLKGNCHIFSLRGPITHRPGYAFYTFEEEGKPSREIFDRMISGTLNFVKEVVEEYGLDPKKVYIIGFNQGAVVAQTLALFLGNEIAGTVALSGFVPEFVKNEYKKGRIEGAKLFISHGEYDYDYPINWAMDSKQFFEEYGANVTFKTYPVGHGVSPENLKDLTSFIQFKNLN
ncbi:alpha/beta hydrolase [Ureibacillus acetophenoni]|uniref:Phospholipase/carboxylesterase n=1 Tax=Ureibacillus acetophenoni TaxID=614649 RepID=A0A285U398_9BACL|nr:dienelactone hydrolase family protein [Ureibacillus acetophenoni]SOC36299.1 phospholipase/carboxylesterase [Ureibacillus acetophenoni]